MINTKALQMIELLSSTTEYISQETLSYKLSVKPRTLREILRVYKEEIEKDGSCSILYKNNYGYLLEIQDKDIFSRYLETQKEELRKEQMNNPVTTPERADYIIRHLLLSASPVKSDDLCEMLNISRSTMAQVLKLVRSTLMNYGLSLEVKGKQGLYIEGDRDCFQNIFSDYFFYRAQSEDEDVAEKKAWIHDLLLSVLQKYDYTMTDTGIDNLVIHIFITLYLSNRLQPSTHTSSLKESKYPLEFQIAREIQQRIETAKGLHIEDNDLGFIAVHMIGNRIFTEKDAHILSADTINIVKDILSGIRKTYDVDLFNDLELFTMLCTHIEPMIQRIQNHVRMRNPMLTTIQEENPLGYDMAVFASNIISSRLQMDIDHNEIGYLALHFQLALERRNTPKRKNILTVCASGTGTSRLLKYKLQNRFGNQIDSLTSMSAHEALHCDLSKYDLIVSTVNLPVTSIPCIVVHALLNESDCSVIQKHLSVSFQQSSAINSAFQEDLFLENVEIFDPTELVFFLCTLLSKYVALPDTFMSKVIERESIASTHLGNGIAVPHPSTVLLDDSKIVIAHLAKPIQWFDKKEVEWVFLLGMKKGDDPDQEALIRALYTCISDIDFMRELSQHPSFSAFHTHLSSVLQIEESSADSIFQ